MLFYRNSGIINILCLMGVDVETYKCACSATPSPLVKTVDFDVSEHQLAACSEKNSFFLDHRQ